MVQSLLVLSMTLKLALLLQAAGSSLSGTVRTEDGRPAARIRVAAMTAENPGAGNGSELVSFAQTDELGKYVLENVPPGRFFISAGRVDSPTYYPGVLTTAIATPLDITSATDISGLDFVVSEPSINPNEIESGLFVRGGIGGAQSVVQFSVRVVLTPQAKGANLPAAIPPLSILTLRGTVVGSREEFIVRLVVGNGTNTVRARLPSGRLSLEMGGLPRGFTVQAMTFGSTDLLTQPLDIPAAPNPIPEIVITLAVDPSPQDRGPQR